MMLRHITLRTGETWRLGDWFRLPDTLHMDGSTFTGEVEKLIANGWGDVSVFFDCGCFPYQHLEGATRL